MGNVFEFAEFELDVDVQQLRRAGEHVKTEALVLRLLETFARSAGRLLSKEELSSAVWGGRVVSENALTVTIARLRKALGEKSGTKSAAIMTVYGRGYRFLPTVSTRETPAPKTACGAETPFVGRERVMADLYAAVINARNGVGSMFVLSGEPGIGKTRIAELAARYASQAGMHVDWVYFRELGELPALWPLRGLLRNILAASEVRSDPRVQVLLPELACLLPELAPTADSGATGRDAPLLILAESAKPRILDAMAETLALAGKVRPQVIILDDLQRADQASLELLNCMLPALPRMRVLIVATMRSAGMDVADAPLTRLLSHRNCERNRLPPLTDSEISNYLDALLGELDPALHRAIQKISEGNAFFMVELGRQLRQNPELDAGALVIPSVALEPVRQRLAQLREDTVSVLTHAAAIGRSFSLARLDAISEIHGTDLLAHLDEAVTNEIVRRAARSPSEFSFTHDLLRAALQQALGPAEWRALRLRALDVLDENLSLTDLDPVHERTPLPALCRAPLAALTHAHAHAHEAQVAESVARLQRMRR